MAHHTARGGYKKLEERLNRGPQGAPPHELLFKIFATLMSEDEAGLVSQLPVKPFTAKRAAALWQMPISQAMKALDALASRAILLDVEYDGRQRYILPPPMAGFFEFSLMRVRDDVDQKVLSELYYQYLNVEEDFVRELFTRGDTQLGRVFVSEPHISEQDAIHVLDYERASEVVNTASDIGIGVCYCRHKMDHVGRGCAAPRDICMTFNAVAGSLIKHDFARRVEAAECLDILQEAREHGLVQFGENVRNEVSFICNCCGCCCEALIVARRFAHLNPVHTTNFLPHVSNECRGCGRCVRTCPVEAIGLVSANDPSKPKRLVARVDEELCLGCAVCVAACRHDALSLKSREKRVITPRDTVHRTVMMAIERGTLPEVIFDEHALASHRVMARVLRVILELPTVSRTLALEQVKSRYLETLLTRFDI